MRRSSSFIEVLSENKEQSSLFKNYPQIRNIECSLSPGSIPLSFSNYQRQTDILHQSQNTHVMKKKKIEREVKDDEFMFQLKLKLISLIKKFNMDYSSYQQMKEQSIQTILDLVLKKIKEYIREKEIKEKQHLEKIKISQIKILELLNSHSNIKEQLEIEKKKTLRSRDRLSEEIVEYQQLIKQKNQYISKLENQIYKQNTLTSTISVEQTSYIHNLEKEHSKELSGKTEVIFHLEQKIRELQMQKKNNEKDYLHNERVFKDALQRYKEELLMKYNKSQQLETQIQLYKKKVMKFQTELDEIKNHQKQMILQNEEKSQEKEEEIRAQYELYKKELGINEELKIQMRSLMEENKRSKLQLDEYEHAKYEYQIQIEQLSLEVESEKRKNRASLNNSSNSEGGEDDEVIHKEKLMQIIEQWKSQLETTVQIYERELTALSSALTEKNELINSLMQK